MQKRQAHFSFQQSHLRNYSERIWRVVLLVLAIFATWVGRRRPIIWLLSGAMLYQWTVLIPVLTTHATALAHWIRA